jgi:hypothetical protein
MIKRADKQKDQTKKAFEIIEEAFHLLRRSPLRIIAWYYIGTLPFIAYLLVFWSDMSFGPAPTTRLRIFGESRILFESFVLASLFIWMKTCQTFFARGIRRQCSLIDAEPTRKGGIASSLMRAAVRQAIIQPIGLIILPLALIATVPFGYTYAFYQNVTVLDDDSEDLRGLFRRSFRSATPEQYQNFMLIWALSPIFLISAAVLFFCFLPLFNAISPTWTHSIFTLFSVIYLLAIAPMTPFCLVVALNIGAILIILPSLCKMLFGIQSLYLDNSVIFSSPSYIALVCGLVYCFMDPLIKTVYVLRNFYLDSLHSGEDLRSELSQIRDGKQENVKRHVGAAMIGVFLLCASFMSSSFGAEENPKPAQDNASQTIARPATVPPASLNAEIDKALQSPEYAWREVKKTETQGVFLRFLRSIAEIIQEWIDYISKKVHAFKEWLFGSSNKGSASDNGGSSKAHITLVVLAIILVVLIAMIAYFTIRHRDRRKSILTAALPAKDRPDLEDEAVTPDALPENGWLDLARQLLDEGQTRLALRAVFLAILLALSQRGFVTIARYKTNMDYREDLLRRKHAAPELLGAFAESSAIYESIWYGTHEATPELVTIMRQYQERLRIIG